METTVQIDDIEIGPKAPLLLISGPCVIEEEGIALDIAGRLKEIADELKTPFIFKASYDKANRSSIDSFRGPGVEKGLKILEKIKQSAGVKILSDVHRIGEVPMAAAVLDMIQIPAFLCRQTDLILAAAETGKPVNIKKGQFLAPWDMANVIDKCRFAGNSDIVITERGVSFGYNNLVVDFRGIKIMQEQAPVIFDATHSVQLPGGAGKSSAGQRDFAPVLAKAAVAAGADAVFLEVHTDPDKALCDGPNSLRIETLPVLLKQLKEIRRIICG